MKIPRLAVSLAAVALLAGCASSSFTPWVGQQDWKTGPGALVDTNHAIPIYYGVPSRPYTVLGVVTANSDYAAVLEGHRQHADALVHLNSETHYAGTVNYSSGSYQFYGNNLAGYSSGVSVPVMRTTSLYAAVQFLKPTYSPSEVGPP